MTGRTMRLEGKTRHKLYVRVEKMWREIVDLGNGEALGRMRIGGVMNIRRF